MKNFLLILLSTNIGLLHAKAMVENTAANVAALKASGKCIGCDLTGLTNADLAGGVRITDISGADLRNAQLPGVDFSYANMDGTMFNSANLSGAKFMSVNTNLASGITPTGIDFSGAILTGANLQSANLTNSSIYSANLTNASFAAATLVGSGLGGANLQGTDFTGANLTNLVTGITETTTKGGFQTTQLGLNTAQNINLANFTSANMAGNDLSGLNLSGTNLSSADLSDANLSHTNVNGANLSCTSLVNAKTAGITGTPSSLAGLNISAYNLQIPSNLNNPNVFAYSLNSNSSTLSTADFNMLSYYIQNNQYTGSIPYLYSVAGQLLPENYGSANPSTITQLTICENSYARWAYTWKNATCPNC